MRCHHYYYEKTRPHAHTIMLIGGSGGGGGRSCAFIRFTFRLTKGRKQFNGRCGRWFVALLLLLAPPRTTISKFSLNAYKTITK